MCQTRTLYSPILVSHFAIALLRLASNTFIVYAHGESIVIRPEILEMQDINPSKTQNQTHTDSKINITFKLDADENDLVTAAGKTFQNNDAASGLSFTCMIYNS